MAPPGPRARAAAGADDPAGFLDRFVRAYVPGRSGQVVFVNQPGYFATFRRLPFNHGSPWDYDSRVPLVFFGPGQVQPGSHPGKGAQGYDIPATLAAAVGIPPPPGSRGRAWTEVLAPGRPRPRALLVVVLDQVGMPDVERFAASMPTLDRWRREGADFPDVRLDYLPTFTAVSHASIGAGAPPAVHGIASNMIPDPEGRLRVVFRRPGGERVAPDEARVPTLADWMDPRFENRSVVLAQIYAEYAATAVAGHGLGWPGGDRDLVFWHGRDGTMATDERWFRVPEYLATRSSRPVVEAHGARFHEFDLDRPGGEHEAAWYARWEAEGMLMAMAREGVCDDEVPDLVMINLKSTDAFGHNHGHEHPGYAETLAEVDRFLGAAEALLGARCGEGGYLAAVTADHGLVPDDGARLVHEDYVRWLNLVLDGRGDGDGQGPVTGVFGGHVYLDPVEGVQDRAGPEVVRRLLLEDPSVRHAWTEDQVRARAATLELDRSQR